jgi:hypothetical protein
MYAKTLDLTYKLGLFYQANADKNNFLKEDRVAFRGMATTALSVYAAWCLVYAGMNGLTDPDYIVSDASAIVDIMLLRKSTDIEEDAENIGSLEIDLGNGYKRTVSDYLSQEEIKQYMVYFNFNEDTSVADILRQYEQNYIIIKKIEDNIIKQSNFDEYMLWTTMKKANSISKNVTGLFEGHVTYSSYIISKDPDLWQYVEPFLTDRSYGYIIRLKELYLELQATYREYISKVTQEQILLATYETDIAGGENIEEIGLLFTQFMSYYTQIYKQSFHVGFDDENNNSLTLLYGVTRDQMFTSEEDKLELYQKLIKDIGYSKGTMAHLDLSYHIHEILKTKDYIYLLLAYEQIRDIMKTPIDEMLEFEYIKIKEKIKNSTSNKLVLEEQVIYR